MIDWLGAGCAVADAEAAAEAAAADDAAAADATAEGNDESDDMFAEQCRQCAATRQQTLWLVGKRTKTLRTIERDVRRSLKSGRACIHW